MPKYSLTYFENLFGERNSDFWELIGALAEELSAYADDLGPALVAGEAAVARLRHDHRPAVTNLGLTDLAAREERLKRGLEEGTTDLRDLSEGVATEARAVAQALISERLQASPEPQSPSLGG